MPYLKNNTVEGITSQLNETENQVNEIEDKIKNKSEQKKRKKIKQQDSLRELWDNMKCNTIHIIGIPEGEEST